MKRLACALTLSAAPALAAEDWIGIFTVPEIPGRSCRIEGAGLVSTSRWGYERLRTTGFGPAEMGGRMAGLLSEDIRAEAEAAGYNAVVGYAVTLSMSVDFVGETGMNWSDGQGPYHAEGLITAVATGTGLNARCD